MRPARRWIPLPAARKEPPGWAAPADETQHLTETRFRRRPTAHFSFLNRSETMSSFNAIAEPTITPEPAPPAAELIVKNAPWFPSIDLGHMRQAVRLDGTVTHARLRDAVIAAIDEANRELSAWRLSHVVAGVVSLADLPADTIGGESVQLARYRRAVYYLARADLTEQYRDFDSTKSGAADADELVTTIDADRRNARHALNDMRGVARSTIELI